MGLSGIIGITILSKNKVGLKYDPTHDQAA